MLAAACMARAIVTRDPGWGSTTHPSTVRPHQSALIERGVAEQSLAVALSIVLLPRAFSFPHLITTLPTSQNTHRICASSPTSPVNCATLPTFAQAHFDSLPYESHHLRRACPQNSALFVFTQVQSRLHQRDRSIAFATYSNSRRLPDFSAPSQPTPAQPKYYHPSTTTHQHVFKQDGAEPRRHP